VLNRDEIEKLIKDNALISDYIDLETQLTPNGFDLTIGNIYEFDSFGAIDFSNKERVVPSGKELAPKKSSPQEKFGWWELKKGAYKVKTNETVNLPKDLIAISFPRSTCLRAGVFTHTGVWDAGFKGKSEFILVIENPFGVKIKQNARIAQLVFTNINETQHSYSGVYQGLK
jgi:dUTP pyrophosphatase